MARCKSLWNEFWWSTIDPLIWGRIRFLFYFLILIFARRGLPSEWAQMDPLLYRPVGVFSWFSLPFPSADLLAFVSGAWLISVVFSAVGLFTRLSVLCAFLFGFYFMSFTNSFGHQYHSELPLLFGLLVMNFTSSGSAFSVDQWLNRKMQRGPRSPNLAVWPLRLIQVLWVLTFFLSGLTKLRRSGWGWVSGGTLQYFLVENAVTRLVELKGNFWETAGLWLSRFPALCTFAAAMVLLFELTTPLAFRGKYWAQFYAWGSLGFLFAVFIFMGVGFGPLVPMVAFWLVSGSVWTPTKRN